MKKKIIFVGTFVLLAFMLLIIRSYFFSSTSNDVITLLPDDSVIKKKPKDPGGLVIPNSDSLVYDSLKESSYKKRKVNILPDPEEPIEISRKQEVSAKILDSIDEILDNIEYYENEYISEEKSVGNESAEYIVPNTLLAKADGDLDDNHIYVPGTKLNIIKALEASHKITDSNVVEGMDAGYKIQLSSAYSQNEAQNQWKIIQQKYKKILHGANLIVKKVEGKNERIFFLVMAGSYTSLSQAKLVCKKLSHRKQNCIVTK